MQGPFGAHDDLLKATASTADEKEGLVSAIKDRAKQAFKQKDMLVCDKLYSKALEVEESATMFANRAAVRLTMGQAEQSVEDARKATNLDATYAKGWYRLGLALERTARFDQAAEAYRRGAELEPESKVWPSALKKCAQAQASWTPPKKEEPKVERYEISSRLRAQVDSVENKKKPCGEANNADDFRGYKLDSQGRRTTYFNHELDAKTKELIGDTAPKKVEQPVSMKVSEGASSWNQAGTFEECNHTAFARTWFQTKLKELMVTLPSLTVGAVDLPRYLTIAQVTGFKGDASTTMARGKKKYLFDITFTVTWEFFLDDRGEAKASGTANFVDVTADAVVEGDPLDVLIQVDANTPDDARRLVGDYVKAENAGLRKAVLELGAEFLAEFQREK